MVVHVNYMYLLIFVGNSLFAGNIAPEKGEDKMFVGDNSKNVVIIDETGAVVYFTNNNLSVYDLDLDDIEERRKVTSLYGNLDNGNSSMIHALNTGKSIVNLKQGLETRNGKIVNQIGSTYPIMDNKRVVGAIELGSFININYKDNIKRNNFNFLKRKIKYTKNGTCYCLDDIITQNKKMADIKKQIERCGNTDSTVLIQGRTGTGKELVAQSIHNCSKRKEKPFVSQNCGAIPESLFESILFGTTKGSFTGAEEKDGLFKIAEGGTLFLDEINSLSIECQIKLLRAIEERRIRKIGSSAEHPTNVRIIIAANEDLNKLVEEKRMREDFYFRLSVVKIELPDLRERKDDIELLTNYFIEKYNEEFGLNVRYISDDVLRVLNSYSWPGNVRELRNVIEASFNRTMDDKIKVNDLPEWIRKCIFIPNFEININKTMERGLKEFMKNCEKNIILDAYKNCDNNLSMAAKQLKISRQLLKYKIDSYKLI